MIQKQYNFTLINFTGNLESNGVIFFIIGEANETVLDFPQGTAKLFKIYFLFYDKMTQYNTFNVKFPNLQFNQLKSGIKNCAKITLKILLNVAGDSHDENNFPHNLLLTNTQVSKLCKAFTNNTSANIKLSKNSIA